MTPDQLAQASAHAAHLVSVLDETAMARLGTDAACVAHPAVQALSEILIGEPSVSDFDRDLGAARFPGIRPAELIDSTRVPVTTAEDANNHPYLIPFNDERPGGDNGPLGLGWLVAPGPRLVHAVELLGGAPMQAEIDRPRQSRLHLRRIGADDALILTVRFTPHLLTVWREGELDQLRAGTTISLSPSVSGRPSAVGEVRAVYPTWPRVYRVLDLGSNAPLFFSRFHAVTADGRKPRSRDQEKTRDKTPVDQVLGAQEAGVLQQPQTTKQDSDGG